MGIRLMELVEHFGGRLEGDPHIEVTRIAPLDRAGATDIRFLSNSRLRATAARRLCNGRGTRPSISAASTVRKSPSAVGSSPSSHAPVR